LRRKKWVNYATHGQWGALLFSEKSIFDSKTDQSETTVPRTGFSRLSCIYKEERARCFHQNTDRAWIAMEQQQPQQPSDEAAATPVPAEEDPELEEPFTPVKTSSVGGSGEDISVTSDGESSSMECVTDPHSTDMVIRFQPGIQNFGERSINVCHCRAHPAMYEHELSTESRDAGCTEFCEDMRYGALALAESMYQNFWKLMSLLLFIIALVLAIIVLNPRLALHRCPP